MRKIIRHPLFTPLVAAVVVALFHGIGGGHERAVLSLFLRLVAPGPHILQPGAGEDRVAWHVWTASDEADERKLRELALVLLEDNTHGVFQSSPHAPIDLALVFRNMHQMGGHTVAVGAVMAWDAPDPIGMAALERALDGFDTVVTTAPLARGATSGAMPAAFRRASLPVEALGGDVSALPVVNRMAIPEALTGGENSLAGFAFIEPGDGLGRPPIMARWDDRIVFSFPFLVALGKAGLELGDLNIRPGILIRSASGDWMVPIDEAGGLKLPTPASHDWHETPAEWLLDADPELWAGPSEPEVWLLRDDRSTLESVFRETSGHLAPMVRVIASGASLMESMELRGVPRAQGWLMMAAVFVLIGALHRIGGATMLSGLPITLLGLVVLQWFALSLASLWLPVAPALLAVNVAWVLACAMAWLECRARTRHKALTG